MEVCEAKRLATGRFLFGFLPYYYFFAAFRVDLAADEAAFFTVRAARETRDFFFAFLTIVTSST
jgi:hypothetical protein